ncbi:MAG: TRAP transporter fused permease subunit [Candidatus Rokubacteria bacterium]|nr:TRAP transporter fused permease subunit [Candidatus Rokubacteria bacterium]
MISREKVAKILSWIIAVEASLLVLYQLIEVWYPLQGVSQRYSVFFVAVFSITLLLALQDLLTKGPSGSPGPYYAKMLLLCGSLGAGLLGPIYLWMNIEHLEVSAGLLSSRDVYVGLTTLVGIIVAGLFTWGPILTGVVCASLLYFFFGDLISGFLGHIHYSTPFIISYTTLHPVYGIYWLIPLTADVVFYVLLFSSVLAQTGTIGALLEIGKGVGRRIAGGGAYPAVVGSALVGTMVGQAVANVVITGRITIPQMKRQGFTPEMAAGIETSASAGSLIMPPVMGLGAFVMAFFLNVPYIQVALAATIPAVLYYAGVALGVYFFARSTQAERISDPIDWPLVVRVLPTFVISLGVLTALLLLMYTPMLAGFWALLAAVVVPFLIQGRYRPSIRAVAAGILDGSKTAAQLGLLLALIGPVAQTVITTGLGPSFANALILSPFGAIPLLALPLVMAATLLTGAAVPEAATYVIMALALAPFLEEVGYLRMGSHMFVFYYSVFATIVPPVAITAMTAAQLAGASFMGTARRAFGLAFVGLLVPFVFAFNPVLLEFPKVSLELMRALASTLAGLVTFSAAWWGWLGGPLRWHERGLTGVAGVCFLAWAAVGGGGLIGAGLVLAAVVVAGQWLKAARRREAALGALGRKEG